MQKNEFEVMVKELLPDVTAQAMEKWTQYAQELEQDGTEKQSDLYDAAYVELQLIKEHQAQRTAANTPIRSFAEDPDMLVKNGRYGPYIAYKGKNYRLPKGAKPETLTLEECRKIVSSSKK